MDSASGISSDATADGNRSERVSEIVIEKVATVKGVDPLELEPLYSVIDPDALDALFHRSEGSPATPTTLHFTMAGCEVLVHGDREVSVIPPLELDESSAPLASSSE